MKKIGIDARLIDQTGVGVYIRNLLSNLDRLSPDDVEFYIYLAPGVKCQMSNIKCHFREAPYRWHSVNEQIGFYHQLMKDDLDLMHFTYFSYPVLYRRAFVITIHDLTPLIFKTGEATSLPFFLYELKHAAYRFTIHHAVQNASAIITPTQTVKKELLEHFRVKDDKVYVTLEGVNSELLQAKESKTLARQFKQPFFLYVSNFYPHKNPQRLIEAFAKTNVKEQLIMVGPDDFFSTKIRAFVDKLGQNERIKLYHHPSIEDFVYFYKNAHALIHPSVSEGFGLPIVEAMYFELPIIASDIPVFRELMVNSFLSFDPTNVDDIAQKITDFSNRNIALTNSHSQEDLLKRFSFENMSKKTLQLYRSLLK